MNNKPPAPQYLYEIVLCGPCEGKGHKLKYTLTDYHRNEHDVEKVPCWVCRGKGRLRKVTKSEFEFLED